MWSHQGMLLRATGLILLSVGCSPQRPPPAPASGPDEVPSSPPEPEPTGDPLPAVVPEAAPEPTPPPVNSCDEAGWLSPEPPSGWWRPLVGNLENDRRGIGFRCLPKVVLAFHDPSESIVETRILRQNFGQFRVCYEAALGKSPEALGHWVGRVRVGSDQRVCSLETIDTTLNSEFQACLTQAFEAIEFTGMQAKGFETALTFHVACRPVPPGSH